MARKYKWEIFVDKVVGGMSQREAYKTTYNCKKMTDEQIDSEASAMIRGTGKYKANPKISKRYRMLYEEAQKQADENAIADATEVLKYLTSVMRGESQAEIVVVEGQGEGISEARKMKKAPDEKERLKAAEALGKRYGLFTEKVEQQVDMELNINIDYGEEQ